MEAVSVFYTEEWADPKAEVDSEPDAPSKLEAAPKGEPVTVCSSSEWEIVTTPGTTF